MKDLCLKVVISLCMLISSINVSADEIPNDQIWYTTTDGKICAPTTTDGFGANIIDNKYTNGKGIIYFDSDVTTIPHQAFDKLSNLSSVILPNSIITLSALAFQGCTELENIKLSQSLKTLGSQAICGSPKLLYVEIPSNVSNIAQSTISYCPNLCTVKINSQEIMANLSTQYNVAGKYNLNYIFGTQVTKYIVGDGVTKIGGCGFWGYPNVTSVEIANSVDDLSSGPFDGSNVNHPVYNDHVFAHLPSNYEGKYVIPDGITKIANSAFRNSIVNQVEIPASVISIESSAFAKCSELHSIIIPKSVKTIGSSAFYGSNITSIYVSWDENEIPQLTYETDFPFSTCDLFVPEGTVAAYKSKQYWNTFRNIYSGAVKLNIENTDETNGDQIVYGGGDCELNDEINNIFVPDVVDNINLTYTRNFANANVWQGWYVPFDVDYADMASAGYSVAQIQGVLLDNDGNSVIAFMRIGEGDVVKANTPYVVKPNVAGDIELSTTTALQPTETNDFYLMSASDKFTFGGIYDKTTNGTNGWYAMNKTGQFQQLTSDQYLRPFRIYMTIDKRDDNPYAISASANKSIGIMIIGDEATAIDGVTGNDGITTAKAAYNLSGQKVNSLQSGQIYIINGKKYIAK